MRLLEKMCFVVLASGLAMGQATATNSGSAGTGSVADELKALREAISQQQKQISQQQQQMVQQQQQIQTLQQQLENKTSGTPHVADASMRTVRDAGKRHCGAGNRKAERVSVVIPNWRHGLYPRRFRGF